MIIIYFRFRLCNLKKILWTVSFILRLQSENITNSTHIYFKYLKVNTINVILEESGFCQFDLGASGGNLKAEAGIV